MFGLSTTGTVLAVIALAVIVGVGSGLAVAYLRNARDRRKSSGRPEDPLDSELRHLTTSHRPEVAFWLLFEGDTPQAENLRKGGRFHTRAGKRVTVHTAGTITVVVVAESSDAATVERFVCSESNGFVSKTEERRQPCVGHINEAQAHNTNSHGMKTVPDDGIAALHELLTGCYRPAISKY